MSSVELLTIQETADNCRVSVRTVFRWLAAERLPAVRIGNVTRVRLSDLEVFLEEHLSNAPKMQLRDESE